MIDLNSTSTLIVTTVSLLIIINLYGYLYSYLIVKKKYLNNHKIQGKDIGYSTLLDRIPLVTFNVSILIILNVIGLYFFRSFFIKDFISVPILLLELIFVLFIDDFFFYLWFINNDFIWKNNR